MIISAVKMMVMMMTVSQDVGNDDDGDNGLNG